MQYLHSTYKCEQILDAEDTQEGLLILYCSFFTVSFYHPCPLFFFLFLCFESNSALWVLFCSLFLSAVLLFMIIWVMLVLVTKPHLISSSFCHCLTRYLPGVTLHSLTAFQSACCSPVLLLTSWWLMLLWLRSKNMLDQAILLDCWRAADLLQLKGSYASHKAIAPRYAGFCETRTNYRSNSLHLSSQSEDFQSH